VTSKGCGIYRIRTAKICLATQKLASAYKLFLILITILVAGPASGDDAEDMDALESIMIDRFAVGMGRITKKKLSDAGVSREDADRIAVEVTDRIRACATDAVEKQSDATPSEVDAAEDEWDMCVQVAFENAGIRFP